jgi:FKBP-type peptidyl-prolyl cis-trans isomerase
MRRFGRNFALVVVCGLLAWGVSQALISKYQQKRQEIFAACKAEREKLGVAEQKDLASKCPTPEISLISPSMLTPGQTAEVVVTGKFPAGTRFLFGADCIEVLKESVAANTYRATVKVGSDCGPQNVSVEAFAPYCCKSARRDNDLSVGGNFEWELKAANGWQVKGRALPPAAGSRNADLKYNLEFYRGQETAPFAKRAATLYPSSGSSGPSYHFSISDQDESAFSAQEELAKLSQQIYNPNLSEADRDKLMKRIQALSQQAMEQMKKMTDPAYQKQLQAEREQFGCNNINVKLENGVLTGNMTCSQKVGTSINLTGALKYIAK